MSALPAERDFSGSPLTMRRVLRQLATFFILLALLILVRFPYRSVAERAFSALQTQLLAQGVHMTGESLDFSPPAKLEIHNLNLRIPAGRETIPFFVDDVKLDFRPLRLLLLQAALEANLSAYQGFLNAVVNHALSGDATSIKLSGNSLALESHPLLSPYGLKGKLSLNIDAALKASAEQATGNLYTITQGSYRLRADEVSYGGGHRIKGVFLLPATEGLQLDVIAGQQENRLTLEQVNLFSSFGTATGSGRLYLNGRNEIERANISATVNLTAEGVKVFGGYLALAAGVGIENPSRRWSLSLSKEENNPLPVFKAEPL